tara:strand:+ start:69 stop:257 length:189 start_codon:yes stop_codon:yes gene_type:complete
VKVGDMVRWTLPAAFAVGPVPSTDVGVIVKMHVANGANVAWLVDDLRITWVPLAELEVVSAS